jgi:asparagine synthase (glutamine-hydrolysing)
MWFMSVQAGIWNYDEAPVDESVLFRLSCQLQEFAPDGESTYCRDSLGMLYRPFHTTPESRLERQPYQHPSGHVLTWDGRLDNRTELVSQLKSEVEAKHTDVQLVAAAYDRWGADCLARIVGDWALAVWDPRCKELILARDYIGIRRLFYFPKPNSLIWCTYLEPLALFGDQFTLNGQYFAGYLALWPGADITPYRQLFSVPPGKFIRAQGGQINVQNYWHFNPRAEIRYKSDTEYEEHYRHLFRQAVRRRLRADSPVLAELSGGLDSSSIVCMADDVLQKEGAEAPALDTFSSFDPNEPDEEDFHYFPLIEKKRGRCGKHVDMASSQNSSTRGYFDYIRFAATPGFRGHPRLSEAKHDFIIERGYRVLLNGTGGDEMSGQALDPRVQLADLLRAFRIKTLSAQLVAWSLLLRRPAIQLLLDAVVVQLPGRIRSWMTGEGKIDRWVSKQFARKQDLSAWQSGTKDGSWAWLPSRRDWFHTITTLSRQMTKLQANVWETRYPCLDQSLVEFLISIPTDQLLRPGDRRSLMRRAFATLLPEEIRSRTTKATSARFYSVALDEHWATLEPVLRSPLLSRLGYVNQQALYDSILDAKNGNLGPNVLRLFKALSWELWLRDVRARGIAITDLERRAHAVDSTFPRTAMLDET